MTSEAGPRHGARRSGRSGEYAEKNKGIAKLCQDAYTAENIRRAGGVHFIHVKGHSEDKGNDKADERVLYMYIHLLPHVRSDSMDPL